MNSSMPRKHFQAIADAMQNARMHYIAANNVDAASFRLALRAAAHELADSLRQFNPAFDKAKFLKACGVG